MKSIYSRVFVPRKQMAYDKTLWDDLPGEKKSLEQMLMQFQEASGEWPEVIKKKFKEKFLDDSEYISIDSLSPEIDELISIFEEERGFKPFSYLEGKFKYSPKSPVPFKFFDFSIHDGGRAGEFLIENDINFENQMACDYPPNSIMLKGSKGCGYWKRQIKPFRLEEKSKKFPARDFFIFDAGPRLPAMKIYGISAKVKSLILHNNITGCETLPIMSHDGREPSGIYQLTITGKTRGAIPKAESLDNLKPCSICGYTPVNKKTETDMRIIIPDDFFSNYDLQLCDRILVEGKEFRGFNFISPRRFASGKFVRMCKENKLKGIDFFPSLVLSEVEKMGLWDEAVFSLMRP